jgi:DNA-binding winged helix-turn-helix (wHTH) protein
MEGHRGFGHQGAASRCFNSSYLIENADRLVTKEELIQAVWPNVVVTDEVLTHCVSEARQAIGDSGQAIIKTFPRRGYRFVAAVSRVIANAGGAPSAGLASAR